MTWPTLTANDVLSGEGAKATVGEGLWDRDEELRQRASSIIPAGGNTTSTSFATVDSIKLWIPPTVADGDTLQFGVRLKHSSGGGTAHFRIQDNGSGTNGSDETVVGIGYGVADSGLLIPASSAWAGTVRTINLQAHNGGSGTATVNTDLIGLNFYVVNA